MSIKCVGCFSAPSWRVGGCSIAVSWYAGKVGADGQQAETRLEGRPDRCDAEYHVVDSNFFRVWGCHFLGLRLFVPLVFVLSLEKFTAMKVDYGAIVEGSRL